MRKLFALIILEVALLTICNAEMINPTSISLDSKGNLYIVSGKGTWRYELKKHYKSQNKELVLNKDILEFWESDFDTVSDLSEQQIRKKYLTISKYLQIPLEVSLIKERILFPRSIALGPSDNIFAVADDITPKTIILTILDPVDGHPLKVFDVGGKGEKEIFNPSDIAVDKGGYIYITNYWDQKVKVYNNEGNFIRSFGRFGSKDGQFKAIEAIAVDDQNGFV